jgi:hypothetical protein
MKSAFVEKEAVISSDVINDEVAASTTMVWDFNIEYMIWYV